MASEFPVSQLSRVNHTLETFECHHEKDDGRRFCGECYKRVKFLKSNQQSMWEDAQFSFRWDREWKTKTPIGGQLETKKTRR